jgi:hypothetical protein
MTNIKNSDKYYYRNDYNSVLNSKQYWSCYSPKLLSAEEALQTLEPLIAQLRRYDSLRQELEENGGTFGTLALMMEILNQKFMVEGYNQKHILALTNQAGLHAALAAIGRYDLHLDIRQLSNGMPVYYLCRKWNDYRSEYNLIAEDLYRSPGYGFDDERFVKLMNYGHEAYFLRLSQFREGIQALMQNSSSIASIDSILYAVGRHIFQAAWHEDQRLGYVCALHFNLPGFRYALELMYLCLSGELCELRSAVDPNMIRFFQTIYPQPAIKDFLDLLQNIDGAALNDIPKRALHYCSRLSQSFSRFLNMEVSWGNRRTNIPLFKLILGNFSRLAPISKALRENESIRNAAAKIEQESQTIMKQILEIAPIHREIHRPEDEAIRFK